MAGTALAVGALSISFYSVGSGPPGLTDYPVLASRAWLELDELALFVGGIMLGGGYPRWLGWRTAGLLIGAALFIGGVVFFVATAFALVPVSTPDGTLWAQPYPQSALVIYLALGTLLGGGIYERWSTARPRSPGMGNVPPPSPD